MLWLLECNQFCCGLDACFILIRVSGVVESFFNMRHGNKEVSARLLAALLNNQVSATTSVPAQCSSCVFFLQMLRDLQTILVSLDKMFDE